MARLTQDATNTSLKKRPLYAVLFNSSADVTAPYQPFITSATSEPIFDGTADVTVPHGLARDMAQALPGLWYCMHLPNLFQQIGSATYETLLKFRGIALDHCFFYAPLQIFNLDYIGSWPERYLPTLAVCPDELIDDVRRRSEELGFALPAASYSELSDESLVRHWHAIHDVLVPDILYFENDIKLTRRLDLAPTSLPNRWLRRQIDPDVTEYTDTEPRRLVRDALVTQAALSAYSRADDLDVQDTQGAQIIPAMVREELSRLSIPVTMAIPGIAAAYSRKTYSAEVRRRIRSLSATNMQDSWSTAIASRTDDMVERAAIELLAAHHATARTGMGLMLSSVPQQAFTVMAEIERHFSTKPKGQVVKRLLDRLDSACAGMWTDEVKESITVASHLTVFSNFPIGLIRYPGDTSPLTARLPITYMPLNPLSRAMQSELTIKPPIDLGDGFSVLVAECIEPGDPVGQISRIAWQSAKEFIEAGGYPVGFHIAETLSPESLREAISEYEPTILVISAHGRYRTKANLAGLVIGNTVCLGPELGDLPPVVILSACHVAPRGVGAVSVTDLLLRQGAYAVLGTQVPVDVVHNSILMSRLFLYLAETLARNEPYVTLLDAWHHVQTSNVVHDILDGNSLLQRWGHQGGPEESPIAEFKLVRSVGRIRGRHLYSDAELVLGEIAEARGAGDRVKNWFRNPGYVPESLFYLFAGIPDCIYLRGPESITLTGP